MMDIDMPGERESLWRVKLNWRRTATAPTAYSVIGRTAESILLLDTNDVGEDERRCESNVADPMQLLHDVSQINQYAKILQCLVLYSTEIKH